MLKLLRDAYREPIRTTPNMHDPNYFTEHFAEFKKMASDLKIHPDDCVALGARLSGFGLAYEVMWNSGPAIARRTLLPSNASGGLLVVVVGSSRKHRHSNKTDARLLVLLAESSL